VNSFLTLDVLNRLLETGVEAAKIDVSGRVHVKDLASFGVTDRVLVIDKNGDALPMMKSQPRRSNTLLSCADVVQYAKHCLEALGQCPIIWISPEAIVVQDDSDRLKGDFGKYVLAKTDLWDFIAGIGSRNSGKYSQADLRKMLRVDLLRAFSNEQERLDLLQDLRSLKTSVSQGITAGKGTHEVGVFNDKAQEISWPDSLHLATTVFEDPSFNGNTWPVEVAFDVRPEEGAAHPFQMSAIPADLKKAEQEALNFASELIRKSAGDIPVFLGSPSRRGD